MFEMAGASDLFLGVFQIMAIDIVLGGDNAIVIALACRDLSAKQRSQGIFWGVFGAVVLRIVLIYFALLLLDIPFLKIAAGLLLFWIGIKLLEPEAEGVSREIASNGDLFSAIRTIIAADAVMSIDNVIGVAGAAKGNMLLIILGISVSIPVIIGGSKLIMRLMDRFPVLVVIGAALIGWIAGEMLVSDARVAQWVEKEMPSLAWANPVFFAVMTVILGWLRASGPRSKKLLDLGEGQ